ncbi:PDZ domain-containing protein [Thermococcus sp. GR7]|uniref:site-2 protease family protein n=1 Tax=unclassified Thermococcus TaxID=2627626 RepID=UPI00142FEC58|nr:MULTISPECIES: site-2 protease family protein [unclassified Thermococcus]NJE46085.1 PDZ domain-containing protein [Thermococcus sp. GR7]NJE78279.1 PDZ domain-containing protein [Thermococcus sp. GR4]NJF22282.1 PDZ domain-containing protein [Thermococcus sp. GR5]
MNSTLTMMIIGILAFWAVLYALFGRKYNEENEEGLAVDLFIAMWRTKKLLGFIDNLAHRWKRFWRVYGDIGIALGFLGMAYVFYALLKTAMNTIQTGGEQAGVQLVIPGITIPLSYGLIALVVVMVVHELSHGVVARAENLPLKSVGLVLLAVIPGAFVEPDEEALEKAPLRTRLRVYGAGSLANIVTALIAVLIINFAITPVLQPAGILVSGVLEDGPAYGVLQQGDVIIAMDGQQIKDMEQFIKFMNTTKPGQVLTITVLRGGNEINLQLKLGAHPDNPERGYIGIYPAPHYVSKVGHENIIFPLFFTFYWIYVLNLGIGLMNLFPLVPLDGGRMLDDVVKTYLPENVAKPVRYFTIGVGLFLLALNLWPALRGIMG